MVLQWLSMLCDAIVVLRDAVVVLCDTLLVLRDASFASRSLLLAPFHTLCIGAA
jgi:hypothetical protein